MQFLGANNLNPPRVQGGFLGNKARDDSPVAEFLRRCKNDVNFYLKCIGFSPTWQQKELVDAFVAGVPNIAVRSGKGPGKTAATAALIPWWSMTNMMSQAVVTAPTAAQCKNVWLSQAQKWVMDGDPRVKYFFNFTGTGYGIRGHKNEIWGCYIRTATKPENFQGIHNERLLIYCEEASGMPRPIMQAIQDTLTGNKGEGGQIALNRWLCVGNPNTRTCRFFDFFHALAGNPWKCLHWNAEETPITPWFTGERNLEIEDEFGKDSDVYRVAVLGEFPSVDPDSLISDIELDKCFTPEALEKAMAIEGSDRQIGIDLARFGGDSNVIVIRQGNIMLKMESLHRTDPNVAVDKAVMLQDHYGWKDSETMYVIDTSGMGEAAVGRLGMGRYMGKRVHEFYSQNTAHDSHKYANKITEAWCLFAKKVRKGEVYLGTKKDRKLVFQLTNRKYSVDKDGRIKIETKDEYKKRNADMGDSGIGSSPDEADAVVAAFYPHAHQSQRIAW